MDFKDRLRYYREQRGYSSDELAKLLDIPYTTLKGYENAGREPKYNILIKIADILNVSLDDLVGRTPADEDERLKKTINDLLVLVNKKLGIDYKAIKINDTNIIFANLSSEDKFEFAINKNELISIINDMKTQSAINEGYLLFDKVFDNETIALYTNLKEAFEKGQISLKEYVAGKQKLMPRIEFDLLDIVPVKQIYKKITSQNNK
ncbi:helix-turn-helix domain-containing protein [Megamonas funiformis]|uniref:helix-turn-helix domain-containing protein n=1 Tax=Megamonas funiformis TaxID=437897 RepID=UPI0022E93C3D|nr:helix-turn-helix transcriptional regulator [Megamonas funiformis]